MTTPTLLNINSSGLSLMHLSWQEHAAGASRVGRETDGLQWGSTRCCDSRGTGVELACGPLSGFDITVLDLHSYLSTVPPTGLHKSKPENKGRFVIVTHTQQGMLGILVDEPPTIMELPLSAIRTFHRAYRQATPLGVANHIAVLPQEVGNLTIFLLNISHLVEVIIGKQM